MIRRTASAKIAAATASETGETAVGRYLLRMPSGKAQGDREMRDMGPFLTNASLSGLACIKAKHGFRIRRKAVKTP
jgi:hypothetical protein